MAWDAKSRTDGMNAPTTYYFRQIQIDGITKDIVRADAGTFFTTLHTQEVAPHGLTDLAMH